MNLFLACNTKHYQGFITMAHRRDAERIVKNLDGEKMAGEKVDIQHAKGKPPFYFQLSGG